VQGGSSEAVARYARVRNNPGFSDLIAPYIQNTETLDLHSISPAVELAQTLRNFPQSMPNLRSLTLSSELEDTDLDWSNDPCEPLTSTLTHLTLNSFLSIPHSCVSGLSRACRLTTTRFNLHLDTLLDFLEENHFARRRHTRNTVYSTFPPKFAASSPDQEPSSKPVNQLSQCDGHQCADLQHGGPEGCASGDRPS
jgi:hypothetical protein